jgi:HJR/Mrr/RecB family endonuclease
MVDSIEGDDDSKTDNELSSAIRVVKRTERQINKATSPFRFQNEISRILAPVENLRKITAGHQHLIENAGIPNSVMESIKSHEELTNISKFNNSLAPFIESQNRLSELAMPVSQLNKFHSQIIKASNLQDRMALWSKALEIQNSFKLPSHILEAVKGINISDEALSSIHHLNSMSDRIREIAKTLQLDSIYIGEYDISDEDENSETNIILPEFIDTSLKQVGFLPLTLVKKVYDEPSLLRQIDPRDFEYFIAEIIEKLGFENVSVTPRSGDGGQDIIATSVINDIPLLFSFECKRYSKNRKIQLETMRALLGTVNSRSIKANKGVLVTTSSFTSGARKFIASEPLIGGKDFNDIVNWMNKTKRK